MNTKINWTELSMKAYDEESRILTLKQELNDLEAALIERSWENRVPARRVGESITERAIYRKIESTQCKLLNAQKRFAKITQILYTNIQLIEKEVF